MTADVLVIGGGLAGAWAALSAAQAGARVVLVDKGYLGTSGVTATAGVGHWYLPPEARPAEIARRNTIGGDLGDPHWMSRTMDLAWTRLPELDRHYRWPVVDGRLDRSSAVRGPEYMRIMRGRVRRAGVTILDHHPATELLRTADGAVGGAAGLRLQQGGSWSCAASATILATGGTAFLSRLLGANNNTGDGYLMAAEAGVHFSAMEFSSFYTVAAAHSTMTRAIPFMYGVYRDSDGAEIDYDMPAQGNVLIAQALLRGPVTCTLERMPQHARDILAHVQPNFLLPLVRRGIDPFRDPFEVTLRGEGTIRGTGGIEIQDDDCGVGIEGLYAAGDVASRQRIVGGSSGGGQPNAAWCVASGTWSGRAAARRARTTRTGEQPRGIGGAGLRGDRTTSTDVAEVRDVVRHEMNDLDKNLFRSGAGLRASRTVVETLWGELARSRPSDGEGPDATRNALRLRESAALVAAARWCLASALARPESRAMHRRTDAPHTDPAWRASIETGGLDEVWVRRAELPAVRSSVRERDADLVGQAS